MGRPTAFISYRRHDNFVSADPAASPFLQALRGALHDLGIDAFIDFEAIHGGDRFDHKILHKIRNCDLFIPLLGRHWLDELDERLDSGERDFAGGEIAVAIDFETVILPILIDGTEWPDAQKLPPQIASLVLNSGVSLSSTLERTEIASLLRPSISRGEPLWRFDQAWRTIYVIAAATAFLLTAIVPNLTGWWEFGGAWGELAPTWGGLFIWPVLFMPFALIALQMPMKEMFRSVIFADSPGDRLWHASPLILAFVGTFLAVPVELYGIEQSPWSFSVRFDPAREGPNCGAAARYTDPELMAVVRYDSSQEMRRQETAPGRYPPWWLEPRNKCWPNAYFYLISKKTGSADQIAERASVQKAFITALTTGDHSRRGVAYSATFYAYAVSFPILSIIGLYGIFIALFLAINRLRRMKWDGRQLARHSDDAWQCLAYAFIVMMMWVPLRTVTISRKAYYYCDKLSECQMKSSAYDTDIVIGMVLLVGFAGLSAGMWRFTKRRGLGVLYATCVFAITLLGAAIIARGDDFIRISEMWRFCLIISIPAMFALLALWLLFSPSRIRMDEAQESWVLNGKSQ